MGHAELLVNQQPQDLLKAAVNLFSAQPVFVLVISLTHMQDLALDLVQLHKVLTDPPLEPVKVPLGGIPSLQHVNHTTQSGVFSKLAAGALDPTAMLQTMILNSAGSNTNHCGTPLIIPVTTWTFEQIDSIVNTWFVCIVLRTAAQVS